MDGWMDGWMDGNGMPFHYLHYMIFNLKKKGVLFC
jgi:hypothetical protein